MSTKTARKPALSVVEKETPPAPMGHNQPPKTIEDMVTRWFELSGQLADLQAREKGLRLEIFGEAFPNPIKGTNRHSLGHGKDLVGDYRINYRIDREAMSQHAETVPHELFNRVIRYKPEVATGEWNKLTPDERRHFGPFVTETPGTPGLEIKNKKR